MELDDEDYDNADPQPPPAKKKKTSTPTPASKAAAADLGSPPDQVKGGVKSPTKGKVPKGQAKKGGAKGQASTPKQAKPTGPEADAAVGEGAEDDPTAGDVPDGGPAGEGGKGVGDAPAGKEEEEEEDGAFSMDFDPSKISAMNAEKMQSVLEQFTPEQMNRYEAYRRSGFQRITVKRLVQSVAGYPVNVQLAIVMAGITKILVGELVETARVVMSERDVTGPIRPSHVREAYRRLKQSNKVPLRTRPTLFH